MVSETNPKKIVTIGGGSGGFTLLRGLRDYPVHITAIATVYDSGGSTGVLRDQYGALPQGDIRRCLLALLPDEQNDWRKLLMHRFEKTGDLSDHAFGNLMLFAAEEQWGRLGGIKHLSTMLGARGTVLPVSVDSAHLVAELSDGTIMQTESVIDTRNVLCDDRQIKRVYLDSPATACRDAVDAIKDADYIILGPGDLYTSIIPNLLTNGIADAINTSKAKLIYVCNLMTKGAETRGYTVVDFITALQEHGIKRLIDYVIGPDSNIPSDITAVYAREERAGPITFTEGCRASLSGAGKRYVRASLVSESGLKEGLVRHSSRKLARTIMSILEGEYDLTLVVDLDDTLCETTRACDGDILNIHNLKLACGAQTFLENFPGNKILLTAGGPVFQSQKIKHLCLDDYFFRSYCAETPAGKSEALAEILEDEEINTARTRTVVLGDRLDAEIAAGNAELCTTVRMMLPGGKYTHQLPSSDAEVPTHTVNSFAELMRLVPFL